MPLKKSDTATPFCKICHKRIEQNSLHSFIFAEKTICLRCFKSLHPCRKRTRFGKYRITTFYVYNEAFQSLLYLYKGCGDIELSSVFLERLYPLLRVRYFRHVIVPAPSSQKRIDERGFDHIPLIFSKLGKRIELVIHKTADVKQSDLSKKERRNIGKHLALVPNAVLRGERVLFVDDVMTTGSTVKACLRLLESLHPKSIEVLVLARVPPNRKK